MQNEALVKSLKQLVLSFESHIHEAGSWDQVEDVLLHLEENDRNFHRYEFVKLLKKHLTENLGDLLSCEIDKHGTSTEVKGQGPLVNQISDKIINSKQFLDLLREMKISLTDASSQLLRNFNSEFCSPRTAREISFNSKPLTRDGSDDDDGSCFNSLNQGSLVFLNADFFSETVESLNKTNSIEVRKEAMHKLNQIPVVDIAGSDRWKQLRRNVLDILSDTQPTLANLGMKFVTRAFSATTPKTSEIYMLLVDHITGLFTSKRNTIPKLMSQLDTSHPNMVSLVKSFRLLNEFQKEAPTYWVRYPDRYMDDIITSTLNLYSVHSSTSLTPLHFISLLDPNATWFTKWMHAKYSREPVLEKLRDTKPLLENAIKSCLTFDPAMSSGASTEISPRDSEAGVGPSYTPAELQYAYFIHSIHVLGQLLMFSSGRRFFPFPLSFRDEPVVSRDIIMCLVSLIIYPKQNTNTDAPCLDNSALQTETEYEPATLATEILRCVCREEAACTLAVCRDGVIHAMVQPIHHALSKSPQTKKPRASESTMLHIADILCMVASNSEGRNVLLYGENNTIHNRSRYAAAHVIAKFTSKALRGECDPAPSTLVIGDFLYICRQLYSTCGGLVVLHQYELHDCIASSLIQVKDQLDRSDTPTPSENGSERTIRSSDSNKSIQWEQTLRDNLLNFASTAKGLLLLQQTGILNDCVLYMYSRYANKLQVSKCEKFGYGCMVTQVATTAPGIVSLQNAGFLKALIDEAWTLLECGPDDNMSFVPKVWPIDPIDRHVHKPLIRLLNVLSSFPAIYETLKGQTAVPNSSYSKKDIPGSVADLMDRMVMVTTDVKVQSLYNYEQTHVFGLRLLSVMISCLDTYLLLESQYKLHDAFIQRQKQNTPNDSKNIIVDMLSVERNYILVKAFLIGGPSERILPPRDLSLDAEQPYPHPMFVSTPIPKVYSPNVSPKSNVKQDNELSRFLIEFRKKGEKDAGVWLERCRTAFVAVTQSESISINVLQNLLDQTVAVLIKKGDQIIFPQSDFTANDKALKTVVLSPSQQLGVKVAIRYGVYLKLVSGPSDAESRLNKLCCIVALFLQRQLARVQSDLHYLQGAYPGFDWFAATVFLMMGGNVERAWRLLHKLSSLAASGYLWPARLHASVHVPLECATSGISPIFYRTAHNIDLVLQSELPLLVSAFKMSGYTPSQICMSWLRQCFWNYLDWPNIVEYVCLCLLFGVDYQVYFCVAVLKHLHSSILKHTQDQDLIIFLKEEPIRDFRTSNYMSFMRSLEDAYRIIILPEMLDFSKI